MFLNLFLPSSNHEHSYNFLFYFFGLCTTTQIAMPNQIFFFPVVGRGLNLGVHSSSDSLPYNLVPVLGLFTMNKLKNGFFL